VAARADIGVTAVRMPLCDPKSGMPLCDPKSVCAAPGERGVMQPAWGKGCAGDMKPAYGDLALFSGDAARGDMTPTYGEGAPARGDMTPAYGEGAPARGDMTPAYGGAMLTGGDMSPLAAIGNFVGALTTGVGALTTGYAADPAKGRLATGTGYRSAIVQQPGKGNGRRIALAST